MAQYNVTLSCTDIYINRERYATNVLATTDKGKNPSQSMAQYNVTLSCTDIYGEREGRDMGMTQMVNYPCKAGRYKTLAIKSKFSNKCFPILKTKILLLLFSA